MKSTIKTLLIMLFVLSIYSDCFSQPSGQNRERMEKYKSMKIAYITENLELTPLEAEKFWPVYNQYEQKKGELMRTMRSNSKDFRENFDQMTEEEASKQVDEHIEFRKKEVAMEEEFNNQLKKILPAKKVMKFYITEVGFREYMLRRIRDEHREDGRNKEKSAPSS